MSPAKFMGGVFLEERKVVPLQFCSMSILFQTIKPKALEKKTNACETEKEFFSNSVESTWEDFTGAGDDVVHRAKKWTLPQHCSCPVLIVIKAQGRWSWTHYQSLRVFI